MPPERCEKFVDALDGAVHKIKAAADGVEVAARVRLSQLHPHGVEQPPRPLGVNVPRLKP
jgi:hypothetical protein